MSEVIEKLIDPAPVAKRRGDGWQQRKSAEMRNLVLETAIDCLVEQGYAGFSAQQIAKRAGISRGALLHHFPTIRDLVAAVVEYTFQMRSRTFLAQLGREAAQADREVETATAIYWDSVQTREFAAYLELVVAARTNAELQAYLLPEATRFESIWFAEISAAFPQWEGNEAMLKLSSDFVAVAHLGLLLQPGWDRDRIADVLGLVERTVGQLYRARLQQGR